MTSMVLLAATADCAHYHPQSISPDASAAAFQSRRLDGTSLKAFMAQNGIAPAAWPLGRWDLNSLTLAAFYFHPDLAVAKAQWQVAAAGIPTARARPNPSITFSPAYDTQIPDNPSPWIVPITFDIPIETAGKRGKRVAEAEHAAESARFAFVAAAWQVRANVRSALQDLTLASRRVELLDQQFSAETNIVRQLREQYAAGAVDRSELTLASIALHKSQLDVSTAQAAQASARSRLAQAVGVPLAALDGVQFAFDFSTDAPPRLTSREARAVALRQRADILGALADYVAADADLRLQLARQYPDLHLGPGYAWNSGNAGDNQWSLGVTLELPILDQNQGPIAEAEARRTLASTKFTALQAQVCANIDRAVAALDMARQQLQTGEKLLAAEHDQLKSAEAQLQVGAGDHIAVYNAQLEAASAGLTQLDNLERLQSAVGALEDALQQPADSLASVIQKITAQR